MNGTQHAIVSPRDNEDNLSMFFNFGTPAQESVEFIQSSLNERSEQLVQRGGIRVSLACIPVSRLTPFFHQNTILIISIVSKSPCEVRGRNAKLFAMLAG